MVAHDRQFTAETARSAIVVVAVVVAGAAFYWLGAILTPLALAVFLMVMVDGFARVLRHRVRGMPKSAALPVAIGVSVVLFCVTVWVLATNMRDFLGQLVGDIPRFDSVIARIAGAMGVAVPPKLEHILQSLNPADYLMRIMGSLRGFLIDSVLVLIYLGFLLASRQGFERKADQLFDNGPQRRHAAELLLRIRSGIERYLWVQTVTGGSIAIASGIVMALIGLDNALFWTFAIFVVGYIPIIGGAIGIVVPPLFALLQFDTLWQAIVLLAVLQTINFIVGNIVYPRLSGRSLNVDPIAILLALAFWGAIWGLPGMFLSTPLTVTAMLILAQFRSTHWVAVLLSADGHPLGTHRHLAERERAEPAADPFTPT
jgi:predicted PurR-regulated permease PerM